MGFGNEFERKLKMNGKKCPPLTEASGDVF